MSEMILFIGLAASGVCAIALVGILYTDRDTRRRHARLAKAAAVSRATSLDNGPSAKRADTKDNASDTPDREIFQRLERIIRRAGLRVTPVELLVQVGIGALALYALGVIALGLSPLMTLLFAATLPVACAAIALKWATARRMAAFSNGLPEALDVFARGLKAGRPVAESIAVVVENSADPIKSEFARCQDELRLGTSLADSLDRLCRRMPTPEVRFFSVATALQGQTGGNLIETMENLATQLRDRRKLRKKAKALSSEARASAVILAALPFTISLAIAFLNPGYLGPLFTDPRGQVMTVLALLSIGLGIFMMIRMGKLHV